ncbi:hypothetical protein HGA11_21195 [Mycolicibacterium septicum DSM 44393]|uniref:Uncharacterized protein n=1 Tax=Mycolicibacterium septicum DSM 44393 TaxID=1341646 RepID=A0A7X6RXI8_9MYCO|nr:hypothetical protein [Mycolicibacterium septicum]NKZ13494.1 hypothetical protein [Mycolicibacterium septicum DSM 44393]
MPQTVDVAARLDQGQPTVETFAEFVWACGLLGYQHPDLTTHVGQVHDWYATEDGLDLATLDSDCAALAAAAGSAEQALRLQDDQLTALTQAWQGGGAQAAREFLLRHGGAAQQAAAAVRRAADTMAALRDQLYRAVDTKVAATERIATRCAAQRDTWLAAARTVRTGLGDRAAASELIDAQVKPFVDNDIGADWVAAMRSATTAVDDAYRAAIMALTDRPVPVFEIPGDLGPSWTPRIGAAVSADPPVSSARTVPAGFIAPVASGAAPVPGPAASAGMPQMVPQTAAAAPPFASAAADPIPPSAPPATNPAASDPASGWGSPLGSGLSGAGLSGAGSGLSGIGQQLADLFGGLIGSASDGSLGPDTDTALPGQLDTPATSDTVDDVDDADNLDDPDDEEDDRESDDEAPTAEDAATEADTDTAAGDQTVEENLPDEPAPVDPSAAVEPQPVVPPPVAPTPPAAPLVAPADKTPCEIAADELPQVGG